MPGQWIVLVEATGAGLSGRVDRDDVLRLLAALGRDCGGGGCGALHSSDRYALQVTATASGPVEALFGVLSSWSDALLELALPTWEVVRTEVLTPEELERDERNRLRGDMPILGSGAGARPRPRRCRR
jgi:hypothetical protein